MTTHARNAAQAKRHTAIGPVAAHSVHEFLHSEVGRRTVEELAWAGVRLTEVGNEPTPRQVIGTCP